MRVGDLVAYSRFIGQLALVEIETQENVRVLWLKKNYCGPWSDFRKSRFKVVSKVGK